MAIDDVPEVGPGAPAQTEKPAELSVTPLVASVEEYLGMIRVGRSLGYDLIRKGEVDAIKLGRRTVITVASIHAMLERNKMARFTK